MDLPDFRVLPAPLWVITTLHIITLTLHFIAMNFLVGGVVAILWGKFTDRWNHPVVQQFVKLFPSAMAATITFGVAPLLFVQLVYGRVVYSASIVSGWFWLLIVPAVIIAYYFLCGASFAQQGSGRKPLYLTLALIAMLYVSFVYSSVFSLAENPDGYKAIYSANQSGLAFNTDIGSYAFRWLHMLFGALTVGGFFVGWMGRNNDEAFKVGKGFFLWGMAAASVLGLAYLFSLGEHIVPLMKSPGIHALTLGIILSLGSLHFFFKKKFIPSAIMVFTSLATMVITRHYVRLIKLEGHFDPSSIVVKPQWDVFAIFLVCFLIAIGLIWYMLRLYFCRPNAGD